MLMPPSTRDATFIDHAAIAQHGPVSAIAAWGDAGGGCAVVVAARAADDKAGILDRAFVQV